MNIRAMQKRLRDFAAAREWQSFHSPKNLAMALMVEAAELLELFQWLNPPDVQRLLNGDDPAYTARIAEEFADVMMYGLQLTRTLNIDITEQILRKIDIVDRRPAKPGEKKR